MPLELSDRSWAHVAAAALFGLAALAVFAIPHGFEGQGAWYLALLPTSIVAGIISDIVSKTTTRGESIVFWVLFVCFDYLWYFGISYAAIKTYRRFFSGPWEGF